MSRDADDLDADRPALPPDPDEESEADREVSDALGQTAAAALRAGAFETPPRSLRDRIMSQARALPFSFVHRDEGIWLPTLESPVATKELYRDSGDRLATRLVRVREGQSLPPSALGGWRSWYVVSGALQSSMWGEACEAGDAVMDADDRVVATALRDAVVLELTRAAVVESRYPAEMEGGRIVRAAKGTWLPYAPGIEVSPIAHGGRDSLVALRLTSGATLDDHEHDGVEELFVLSGSCVVERRPLREGDYHRANAGSEHAETQSGDDGCLLLVSLRPP